MHIPMKNFIGLLLLLSLLAGCDRLTLRSAEQESFRLSSAQTGQDYEISVLLPPDYDETASYPTVYLIDGHWHFGHAAADAQRMMEKGDIRDVLLVGIAYADLRGNGLQGYARISELRIDDLTFPKNVDTASLGGKAFEFRAFIKDDLIPSIEDRYAASSEERTLMGHSLGGYFGIWEMFTFADTASLFVNIESGSPALWWADGYLLEEAERLQQAGTSLPFRLHTTMGSLESVTWNTFFDEFEARLQDYAFPGLSWTSERYAEGHTATASTGFEAGLLYFFGN
jgi:predicted alpha/beta superfamily hydrolase